MSFCRSSFFFFEKDGDVGLLNTIHECYDKCQTRSENAIDRNPHDVSNHGGRLHQCADQPTKVHEDKTSQNNKHKKKQTE